MIQRSTPHSLGDVHANQGELAPALFALEAFALILASEGEAARALELYTVVGQHPYVKHSRWRQANYDRYISPLAAALPPAEREAAIARGQQGEVHATAAAILAELSLTAAVGKRLIPC